MARTVQVKLGERSYDIRIGSAGDSLALPGAAPGTRVLVVTDSKVDRLHGVAWEQRLQAAGYAASRVAVPAGESSKSMQVAAALCERAVSDGLDRKSVILALGGGMVGDLAGFVAGILFRGVRFAQAPTTLLAMVDSSVGGKTAVNLPQGKNLAGVFHQPVAVFADLATLATLPEREYRSGLAEVVKYGAIADADFFGQIERAADALMARDPGALEDVVARCCELKADVVSRDEREAGPRANLNFGHTLAHALESAVGYGGWLHGEAVSVGMVYAARLSALQGGLAAADEARLTRLLARLGLPVCADARGPEPAWADLRRLMSADKKSSAGLPRFVLLDRIGAARFGCELPEKDLTDALAAVKATVEVRGVSRQ